LGVVGGWLPFPTTPLPGGGGTTLKKEVMCLFPPCEKRRSLPSPETRGTFGKENREGGGENSSLFLKGGEIGERQEKKE